MYKLHQALPLNFSISNSDPLPRKWQAMSIAQRHDVYSYLCQDHPLPSIWMKEFNGFERKTIVEHLQLIERPPHSWGFPKMGLYPKDIAKYAECPLPKYVYDLETTSGSIQRVRDFEARLQARMAGDQIKPDYKGPHAYERPNGGKRILPSVYTRLNTHWMRSTGKMVHPSSMDADYLRNCIALLEESFGNLMPRMSDILKKVHAHMQNDESAQFHMQAAYGIFKISSIEQVYPIYTVLKTELEGRVNMSDNLSDEDIHW